MEIPSLLDRLEAGLLDEATSLKTLLRTVQFIGGRASSSTLQKWTRLELEGYYDSEDDLPSYRMIPAQIQVDARTAAWRMTQHSISVLELPKVTQGVITEQAAIATGIGQVETMVSDARPGGAIKLALPGAAEIARMMSYEHRGRGMVIDAAYWAVHPSALQDVLDQVRNRLVRFVAELRSTMPASAVNPTAEQVERVVQHIWVVTGNNSPVTLTAPLAYAAQDASASAEVNNDAVQPASKRRLRW